MTPKLEKSVDSVGSDPSVMGNGETENIALKMSTTILFDFKFEELAKETVTISYAKQKNYFNLKFDSYRLKGNERITFKKSRFSMVTPPMCLQFVNKKNFIFSRHINLVYSTLCNYG